MAIDFVGLAVTFATFASFACIYALLTLGLNLQWGETGLFNAGIAAFYAIGAYTTAILITGPAPISIGNYPAHLGGYSWPWLPALAISGLTAGFAGLLIALTTLRLRTDYLAIATLGLGEVIRLFLANDEPVTGGTFGIYQIPGLMDFFQGAGFTAQEGYLLIAVTGGALVAVAFTVLWYLGRSPWTRALKSIREDEDAAEVLGKDTFTLKLQSFVLGCAIMGIAGSLYTVVFAYIEPVITFKPQITFTVWAMLILGGSGNHKGAILGAFLFYATDFGSQVIGSSLTGGTGIPSTAPLLAQNLSLLLVTVPFVLLDVAVFAIVLWPRWRKLRGAALRRAASTLAPWIALEAITAWGLYYSLLNRGYLITQIPYFRLIVVGFVLIVLIVYRPQGVLKEKLVTVRRRTA